MRTQVNFKGIDVETKLRLKVMAASKGVPLYQLLDEIVQKAWEKGQNRLGTPRISRKSRKEVGPIPLANEEKWESEIVFVPMVPGESEKVEFTLYKNGDAEPLLEPLHLWINVKE